MKKYAPIMIIFMLLTVSAFAQCRVKAEDILGSIDEGQVVEYTGVEIIGDLDITSIKDGIQDTGFWRFFGFSRDLRYHVRIPLIFRDCIFRGDVIAYRHDRWNRTTHNVSFHENVSFHGCEFMGRSAFKYAEFLAEASFAGSNFSNAQTSNMQNFQPKSVLPIPHSLMKQTLNIQGSPKPLISHR